MNLRVTLGIAGATVALAAPAVATAKPHTTAPSASQQCRTERARMGGETFAATYGTNADRSNAFGKCVSRAARQRAAAAKQTRSEAKAARKAAHSTD